jgi:hypothetical protein
MENFGLWRLAKTLHTSINAQQQLKRHPGLALAEAQLKKK